MARRRGVLAIVVATALVTGVARSVTPGRRKAWRRASRSRRRSGSRRRPRRPSTTVPLPTTIASSTAAPATPSPTVAPPPPPVAPDPSTSWPVKHCQCRTRSARRRRRTSSRCSATSMGMAAATRSGSTTWPDGPHLQIRSDRGVTDAIRLGFGQQAVALGLSQVDLIVGGADPGTPQEILAVVSGSDGTRLAGVYTLALRTGCLDEFEFPSGSPFVYLVGRNGTYTGLPLRGRHPDLPPRSGHGLADEPEHVLHRPPGVPAQREAPRAASSLSRAPSPCRRTRPRSWPRATSPAASSPGRCTDPPVPRVRGSLPLEDGDGAQTSFQVVLHGPGGEHGHLVRGR